MTTASEDTKKLTDAHAKEREAARKRSAEFELRQEMLERQTAENFQKSIQEQNLFSDKPGEALRAYRRRVKIHQHERDKALLRGQP